MKTNIQKIFISPFLVIVLLLFNCRPANNSGDFHEFNHQNLPKEVYPKTRKWCSPSAGIEPETNPPAFIWPISQKGNYTLRISRDSLFEKEEITVSDLPWAIYNPHQKFPAGIWYWQVKSSENSWGSTEKFMISDSTRVFETPEFTKLLSQIPNSHPRVLIFAREIDDLRNRSMQYKDSQIILQLADKNLEMDLPSEEKATPTFAGKNEYQTEKIAKDFSKKVGNEVLQLIEPVCQAYILTGNKKYISKVVPWSLEISSWDPEGATRVNDFSDSQIMYAMALIYDTFYEHLSAQNKKQLLAAIAARASHFYDHWINYLESRQVSNHVWQFNLYRLFMTSLAVVGDIPAAKNWLNYIYQLWLARAPILGGNDGGWVHGVSYFHINTVTLLDLPTKLRKITGVNFLKDNFFYNNMTWLNYAYPPFSTCDGFADDGEVKRAPDFQILGYVDALARLNQDSLASWYLEKTLYGKPDDIFQNENFRWFRITRGYQMPIPQSSGSNDLPLAKVFPDVGMVYMHSNLNDYRDNLMVAMRSSPYGSYSHMHADQNTVNIAYGGKPLFFNSGYKVSMGDKHSIEWYKATQGHNGILINGQGQDQSSAGWGFIERFISGDNVSYALGEAAPAYNHGANAGLVKTFKRHLLMIHSLPIIIIYDELEVAEESTYSWLFHSYKKIAHESDNWISSGSELVKGWVYLDGSLPLEFQITDQFAVEPVNFRRKKGGEDLYPDQWHFKAENKTQAGKMRFLAIIQVATDNIQPKLEIKGKGSIFFKGWQIDAEMDVAQQAKIQIKNTDGLAVFTSTGTLKFNNKAFPSENSSQATLLEILDGSEKVKFSENIIPKSFYEAYYNQKQ